MKLLTTKIFIIWAVLFTHSVSAQTYVGIPANSFNFYARDQRGSQWCWAASMQMIFNYYGVNITQDQIVVRTYGGIVDSPGSNEAITANLNNLSVDQNGRYYAVFAQYGNGAPNPTMLINALSNQQPVMIGYDTGSSGHAVVVTACSYINTLYGPQIYSIVVRDPWPTSINIANNGRVEYSGADLASRIKCHWFISVR